MSVYRVADDPSDIIDLWNEDDEFGEHDDVLVITDTYGDMGPVATYDADDLIVLNNFSTGFDGPVCGGRDDDDLIGGADADVLVGGTGDDVVLGRGGNDEIFNDRGDDFYRGGAGADFIHFSILDADRPFEGVANTEGVTCDLRKTAAQNLGVFGNDVIRGIENIFGGTGDDTFIGTDGVNAIEGRDGNDVIRGLGGDDFLFAFNGNDTITGGRGADAIVLHKPGRPGNDVVIYAAVADSGPNAATRDTVSDFDVGGNRRDRPFGPEGHLHLRRHERHRCGRDGERLCRGRRRRRPRRHQGWQQRCRDDDPASPTSTPRPSRPPTSSCRIGIASAGGVTLQLLGYLPLALHPA